MRSSIQNAQGGEDRRRHAGTRSRPERRALALPRPLGHALHGALAGRTSSLDSSFCCAQLNSLLFHVAGKYGRSVRYGLRRGGRETAPVPSRSSSPPPSSKSARVRTRGDAPSPRRRPASLLLELRTLTCMRTRDDPRCSLLFSAATKPTHKDGRAVDGTPSILSRRPPLPTRWPPSADTRVRAAGTRRS
jgi:hypothetical protein